jgi:hypothetical protein
VFDPLFAASRAKSSFTRQGADFVSSAALVAALALAVLGDPENSELGE